MLRLSSLRPLLESTSARLSTRQTLATRSFTISRPNVMLNKRPNISIPGTFSRLYMTERPIIQRAQGISWQRMAITAAGVAGAVVVIEGVLNRETREGLSIAEKDLLHSAFQYTGGGLVLTALAARSMFRSGFAYRIMAANPCA
ncbi:hypothetical protein H0H81_012237 [Sphagnurus paluster]|uniref:Uncharacterized protein n=1 Tax=Sphagnurus paluster TaxID=117069 RepID=A0A9P7K5X8_9AGAR|nr:hypothetical protein H0H81_012237 [Sphagnurus paluster]